MSEIVQPLRFCGVLCIARSTISQPAYRQTCAADALIQRIYRKKSPLKISGKVAVGVVRSSRKFSGHPYIRRIARSSLRQLSFLVMKIISLSSVRIFLTTAMFLLTEPQDLHGHGSGSGAHYENGCTRPHPESRTSATYENALWTNGKSWISASSTKPLRCGRGERDFEFV